MPPRQTCASASTAAKSSVLLIHVNVRIAITFTVNFIYSISTLPEANSLPRLFTGAGGFLYQLACGEWVYTKHAVDRAIERGIWSYEVNEAIRTGEIIEDYPNDKYRPSCLILGWTKKRRPLHLQVSYAHPGEKIKVITLYEPDLKE